MEYMTNNYENFKRETDLAVEKIRTGAMTMAQGWIELGYQLKVARDTGILQESGYNSMADFARAEYGIRPDQATRYIEVNDYYSEGGYSRNLKGRYAGIGVSLLVDMLQLPDAVRDEITQSFSREDIRSLASEVKEENAITDLEVMMEEKDAVQEELPSLIEQAIYQFGKELPELYAELFDAVYEENVEAVIETLVPDEEKIYSLRIPGTGRMLLSLKSAEEEIKLINVRSQEKESYTWQQLEDAFRKTMHFEDGPIESWEKQYRDRFPHTETSASKAEKTKPEKKESKVQRSKKTEPKPKEVPAAETMPEAEQIPGQDTIMNHPELLPEGKTEIAPAQIPAENTQEEFEPQPENMSSICYSCSHWSECNMKSNTVTDCNEYNCKNQMTEKQKYEMEQAAIDRETKRKLEERAQEEKLSHLPSEEGQQVYQLRLASTYFADMAAGVKSFDLRKNDRHYKAGDLLEYLEFTEGRNTGHLIRAEVTYILEDYTGLEDGYCIMAIRVTEVVRNEAEERKTEEPS